ncbi:uncharacterized protein ZBIST_3471 [Zygosaccharomyces bailii]|uniref:ZYBA0S05-07778g1_1 n=1 Tax=Zygosaccharomyces bailii (strain CLIB 213 / ATCC 58445 / CBS 680 / BCRC 21525 / NBRC 1098 / NCYC 1416 / NRRL Y-2227) TaxID=1333698 RepID=A0A8J2X8J8_ZYGB2|nr:ZYBA0S05-07778g1_1 [Zygosaccharomyces bailii CLIB 213]SJM87282.1 uncharacterized protein ZBIST_3471 [Zygosaccharomyces bailii]
MSDISASEYISRQNELEKEAKELMPWDPNKCTYELGPLRQSVFACRSHNNIGLCYSCSIQCHTKCDIVELFTKRYFTCDCGTDRDNQAPETGFRCRLRENREADVSSLSNKYGQNFQGLFCVCSKEYDPNSDATMVQCVLGTECDEDWYHDYCIGKQMPPLESFDAFICSKCAAKYDYYFKRILSHPLGEKIIAYTLAHEDSTAERGGHTSDTKTSCLKRSASQVDDVAVGEYSIFLKHGYSEKLKELKKSLDDNNDKLFLFLNDLVPFLVEDEPVYEPPEEGGDNEDDLISNILQNAMQREQAVAGISAFNALKVKLNDFLRPFAETGSVVKEEDIKSFFQKPKET